METPMDSADDAARRRKVWEMIKDIGFASMVTHAGGRGMRARPMAARGDEHDGALWFFTRAQSGKVDEIESDPEVLLVYADPRANAYVSVGGTASVVKDDAQAAALWTEAMRVWFPRGPTSPDLALIRVEPRAAEYWDSAANAMVVAYGYVVATLTGETPDVGEHGRVDL
jgi:general stress protein 26